MSLPTISRISIRDEPYRSGQLGPPHFTGFSRLGRQIRQQRLDAGMPNPITKLTWDNAILISPKLAKSLQVENPDLGLIPEPTMLNKQGQIAPDNANFADGRQKAPIATIAFNDQSIEGPLYVQPGLADYTVVTTLGMGRKKPDE